MNILNLLTKEKNIAGIEISDRVIRIAYFRPRKKFTKEIFKGKNPLPEKELILIEEPIPTNIIKEGIVLDKDLLSKILKDIWTRSKLASNYAIISIPEDRVYSKIYPFPKTVTDSQLRDAINLAIDFQFPVKKENHYIGWENAGDSHLINEVLISSIPKDIANAYIEALESAGIKILALESHLASITRSVKTKLGQTVLFLKRNYSGASIFILKDGSIRFSRNIPEKIIKNESFIEEEVSKIKTFFETEKKKEITELPLMDATLREEYLRYPEINENKAQNQSKWLAVMGAVIRGQNPREKDKQISLLPVGTVEAYMYQKTLTFITLSRNIVASVGIFFLITFFAAFLFIFSLNKSNNTINIPNYTTPSDLTEKQELISKTNLILSTSEEILSKTINWSTLVDEIKSRVIDGIIISNFTVRSENYQVNMVGTAKDRDTLNLFKKTLQDSAFLTAVELPVTNIQQKTEIPFSISFRIKDLNMLYYK